MTVDIRPAHKHLRFGSLLMLFCGFTAVPRQRQSLETPSTPDLPGSPRRRSARLPIEGRRAYPQVRRRFTFWQQDPAHGDVMRFVLGKGASHRIMPAGTGDDLCLDHLIPLQTFGPRDMIVGDEVPRRRYEKPGGAAACLVFVSLADPENRGFDLGV